MQNKTQPIVKITKDFTVSTNQCSSAELSTSIVLPLKCAWLEDNHIIGYRTVRGYVREDLSNQLVPKLGLRYVRGKGWMYIHNNGGVVIFTFNKYGKKTTCIEFSIPRLLYGDRIRIADRNDAEKAVGIISKLIGRDFSLFNVSRLDITTNFKSLGNIEVYRNILHRPLGFLGYTMRQSSIVFHNRRNQGLSGQLLKFYKRNDILRVEASFISGSGINVKELIKNHIGHRSQVSEILKESFYDNCVHYFYDLVLRAIAFNDIDDSVEVEETIKNLRENYDNTYQPKRQLDLL